MRDRAWRDRTRTGDTTISGTGSDESLPADRRSARGRQGRPTRARTVFGTYPLIPGSNRNVQKRLVVLEPELAQGANDQARSRAVIGEGRRLAVAVVLSPPQRLGRRGAPTWRTTAVRAGDRRGRRGRRPAEKASTLGTYSGHVGRTPETRPLPADPRTAENPAAEPNGAAKESNLPTAGLRRPAGFEDRMGHQARAAPPRRLEARATSASAGTRRRARTPDRRRRRAPRMGFRLCPGRSRPARRR
jgi:hypothetical protein